MMRDLYSWYTCKNLQDCLYLYSKYFKMFDRLTGLIWGDYNQKQINTLRPIVTKINQRYDKFETLSDDEIKAKTPEFRERLSKWETLDDILPEAFAVVKQAAKRMVWDVYDVKWEKQTWNMIPYDVQLLGWIILHQGKIAEMKTWEWKTLVAAAPVYLNALSGNWVHVVTVNDYLASRDAQWIGYLYQWLGLTVGSVVKWTPLQKRREEYSKDITYVENSELWFDYLRDNLVQTMERRNLIWRPLNFAIVDEIDSILVDEARTPLIISEAREEPTEKYTYYANIVNMLTPCSGKKKVSKWLLNELINDEPKDQEEDGDYYIDEKTKTASLSWKWIAKLEQLLNVENLYKDFWFEEIHHIENALRAKAVYIRDVDYIVSNWEVLIVDEHTGRTMPWRRFSEWLHQAIEAKENVQIQRESQTMATITYQNFFKQYKKLAGMTGTAATEAEEFQKIYELEVVIVPTNKPILRVDKNDKVYYNQQIKWKFVKDYIKFYHEIWQPILIWTADIATSEYVSRILEKDAITHYVLNAKFHEQEAHIVANAWKYQSVVVATNMAWRWTDIKLEEWLNEKMSANYAKWCEKQIKNQTAVKINVYSKKEYVLDVDSYVNEINVLKGKYKNRINYCQPKSSKSDLKWLQIMSFVCYNHFCRERMTGPHHPWYLRIYIMIHYIDKLYLTEKTDKDISKIKRKLRLGIGTVSLYVIMLSKNSTDVFEIVPAQMFKLRKYRHMDHTVIGIAESRKKAYEIVTQLINEHFMRTGQYTGLREDYFKLFSDIDVKDGTDKA